MVCNMAIDEVEIDSVTGFDSCNPAISIKSKLACSQFEYTSWVEMIKIDRVYIITFLLFCGLLFLFLGSIFKSFFSILVIALAGGLCLLVYLNKKLNFPVYCKKIINNY